jgi:hypothetical protein
MMRQYYKLTWYKSVYVTLVNRAVSAVFCGACLAAFALLVLLAFFADQRPALYSHLVENCHKALRKHLIHSILPCIFTECSLDDQWQCYRPLPEQGVMK